MQEKEAMVATHFFPEGMTLKQYNASCGRGRSVVCPECRKRVHFRAKFLDMGSGTFKEENIALCTHCLTLINVKTGKVFDVVEPMGASLCGEDIVEMSDADSHGSR